MMYQNHQKVMMLVREIECLLPQLTFISQGHSSRHLNVNGTFSP